MFALCDILHVHNVYPLWAPFTNTDNVNYSKCRESKEISSEESLYSKSVTGACFRYSGSCCCLLVTKNNISSASLVLHAALQSAVSPHEAGQITELALGPV